MRILLWKKIVELKREPVKFFAFLILPLVSGLVYYYLLKFPFGQVFSVLPMITTCFSTLILFNVEEISYMTFYVALGLRVRTVWISNLLFILLSNYLITDITLLVLKGLLHESVTTEHVVCNLLSVILAFFLLGMSTLHYLTYSRASMIIASVFAIINMISPGFIYIYQISFIRFEKLMFSTIVCSTVGIIGMLCYMRTGRNEVLCENTKDIINGYHEKFITED